MMDGIEAAFTGTLALDPERRVSGAGKPWVRLPIAVGKGESTTWVSVAALGPLAADADKIERGSRVYVEGVLTLGTWTDKAGKERHGLNVRASKIEVLGRIGKSRPKEKDHAPGGHRPTPHQSADDKGLERQRASDCAIPF